MTRYRAPDVEAVTPELLKLEIPSCVESAMNDFNGLFGLNLPYEQLRDQSQGMVKNVFNGCDVYAAPTRSNYMAAIDACRDNARGMAEEILAHVPDERARAGLRERAEEILTHHYDEMSKLIRGLRDGE